MPSVINLILEDLGQTLDDKARTALQQVDGVSALAFLQRIIDRGESVRNPSAFIATAVRNAGGRGPGAAELESALTRLRQDGTLDDNAVDALKKGSTEDACHALASLLSQEASSVRNASAYVTRNLANARKQQGQPMLAPARGPQLNLVPFVPQMAAAPAPGLAGEALLSKWSPSLDEKAMAALMSLNGPAAQAVLRELDAKGGSVRNPSAYVQKACENRKEGVGAAAAAPDFGPSFSQGYGAGPRMMGCGGGMGCGGMGFGGMGGGGMGGGGMGGGGMGQAGRHNLDQDAMDALQKVAPEQASAIIANLEARSSSVRNPSAYVVRSVKNLLQDGQGLQSAADSFEDAASELLASFSAPPRRPDFQSSYQSSFRGSPGLDAGAAGALAEDLDESARSALSELAPESQEAILQQLEAQAGKVNNPSAYVLRAVGNARRGKGAGGTAAGGASAQLGLEEELSKLSAPLDAKAMSALEELGPVAATAIVQKLAKQQGTVNNPNAYIMRAVGNEKRTQPTQGFTAMKRPRI